MLRKLAWIELLASILLLALAVWPLSGLCSGRPLGYDCESWFIFGVNLYGPVGLLALGASVGSFTTRSWVFQYILVAGVVVVAIRWVSYAYLG